MLPDTCHKAVGVSPAGHSQELSEHNPVPSVLELALLKQGCWTR